VVVEVVMPPNLALTVVALEPAALSLAAAADALLAAAVALLAAAVALPAAAVTEDWIVASSVELAPLVLKNEETAVLFSVFDDVLLLDWGVFSLSTLPELLKKLDITHRHLCHMQR
tara:strand:+ start:64 stop:411 length:348 start_codon:yes stop_codon:yes gene_type:complete